MRIFDLIRFYICHFKIKVYKNSLLDAEPKNFNKGVCKSSETLKTSVVVMAHTSMRRAKVLPHVK